MMQAAGIAAEACQIYVLCLSRFSKDMVGFAGQQAACTMVGTHCAKQILCGDYTSLAERLMSGDCDAGCSDCSRGVPGLRAVPALVHRGSGRLLWASSRQPVLRGRNAAEHVEFGEAAEARVARGCAAGF